MSSPARLTALPLLALLLACHGSEKETDPPAGGDSGTPGLDSDSGSDPGTETGDEPLHVTLTGAVAKGPFIRGSSVDVAPLDASGAPTGASFATATSDDAGRFELDLEVSGPVRIEAEGYYYNEVTGQLSAAPITLRSYHSFVSSGSAVAFVNAFTHLTSARVATLLAAGSSIEDAVATAEREAVSQLHVAPSSFSPGAAGGEMDLLGGDADANAWLFALSAVLAQHAVNLAGEGGPVDATLSEALNGIAADLADGALDGGASAPSGDELYALQATMDADAIMALLAARFAAIGSSAEVPDLHRVFDLDLDGIVDREDSDADGDGHARPADGGDDCDDYDAIVHPDAPEDFSDGVDVDCTDDTDGDGHLAPEAGGDDCDDDDAATYPGAAESWYDGVDQGCDGGDDYDQDGDGGDASAWGGDDCDDTDATISSSATERCDTAADDDCDGDTNDEGATGCGAWNADRDGDGFGATESACLCEPASPYTASDADDCDDDAAGSFPGAVEIWYDGVDEACDGGDDDDQDGDGEPASAAGGDDCDDTDATVSSSATERCDTAADDDCDGDTNDEGAIGCTTRYVDADGDGHGGAAEACRCEPDGVHTASAADDCDDDDSVVYPGAEETCWSLGDEDCDGASTPCIEDGSLSSASVKLAGASTWEGAGTSVSSGDINGDGRPDLLVGAGNYDGGNYYGAAYVVLGSEAPASALLSTADAKLTGETRDNASAVVGVGDVDADGYGDVLIGAWSNTDGGGAWGVGYAGAAYLVLGSAAPSSISLGSADAQYTGRNANDWVGGIVAAGGDANGDGFADLLVTGFYSASYEGVVYLVLGSEAPTSMSLGEADARFVGESSYDSTNRAAGGGDLDGDGQQDLLIGSVRNSRGVHYGGTTYVILGSASIGTTALASADALYTGEGTGNYAGTSVACDGDANGDGYDDLLIGAPENTDGGTRAGAAYLVLGASSLSSRSLSAADAEYAGPANLGVGTTLAFAGDVNADGFEDILVGDAPDTTVTGSAFLVLGSSAPASTSLSDADARFDGEARAEYAGSSVAGVGDVDGNGFDDLLIGAPSNTDTYEYGGAAYLLLSGR